MFVLNFTYVCVSKISYGKKMGCEDVFFPASLVAGCCVGHVQRIFCALVGSIIAVPGKSTQYKYDSGAGWSQRC